MADIERLTEAYDEAAADLDALVAQPGVMSAEERAAYDEIVRIQGETLPVIDEVVALRQAGRHAAAQDLLLSQASRCSSSGSPRSTSSSTSRSP